MTARSQAFKALHYALAPICIALAALLHLSPAGPYLHPTGLFVLAVVAAAWFGGVGPGFFAALLATLVLPQLIELNYPLTADWLDLPRFVTFAITGLAVGLGTTRRQRAAALQRSEERYAIAMNAGEEGFWDWIVATDEFHASPRMLEMCGFPRDAVFSSRADFLARFPFAPGERARWQEGVDAHFAGKSARLDMEIGMQWDGAQRWIHTTGMATRDASGAVVRWTGATRDVTARRMVEDALRYSEVRYALVMNASDEGFWDWNVATDEFYASPRMLEMYGFPPDTRFASRADFIERFAFHPEDRPKWAQAVTAHFAGKSARFDIEIRMLRDGATRWIHLTGLATRDASGAVVRWTGATRDVTARRAAEEALRLSEERYALAMTAAEDAHWDWIVGTDQYYLSPRTLDLFGLPAGTTFNSREDYLARTPLVREDLEKWQRAVAELFAGTGSRLSMEVRAIVRGETRWMQHVGVCLRDVSGRPVRWCGTARDVTERRRTEEALRLSEERYARALKASEDGIWEWNPATDRMFVSARARELLGVPDGVQIDTRARLRAEVRFHPEDRQRTEQTIQASLARRAGGFDMEYRVIDAAGEMRWLRSRAKVFPDAQGAPALVTGSLTDVTKRKCAEQALRESEKRYERAMLAAEAGFWDWYLPTDAFYVSPKLLEMGGFALGTTFADRASFMERAPFHPDDRAKWQRAVSELFAGSGSRLAMELRVLIAGETRWHNLNGICFRDAEGKVVRWAGSTTDVTERRRTEEALRLSEERYALAVEAAGEGHSDWNLETGEFHVSPRLLEICGYAPGTTFKDRAEWVQRFPFHPEDRPKWEQAVAAHMAGPASRFHMEARIVVRGETRWVAFTFLCSRDASGKAVRWTGSTTDVTDRKGAELALRASEERYALAMQASGEGHWDWKIGSDEFYASPRYLEIGGFPPDTKLSRRTGILDRIPFHPEDRPKYEAAVAAHFAGETPRMDIVVRIMPHGEIRWLHVIGMCSRDAGGRPVRWAGSVNDVTERMRAEESLRISEERYARAMEGSDAGHWDWNLVTDEMFVSQRAREMLGVDGGAPPATRTEIMALARMHPEDRQAMDERVQASLTSGVHERNYRVIASSGDVRWLRSRAKVFLDASGKAARMTGSLSDITQSELAADALRESEARFRSLTELSSDYYWRLDENLRFSYMSDQAYTLRAFPAESPIGKTRWELPGLTPLSCSWAEHQATLAARQPFRDLELSRVIPDGSVGYFSVSGAPIFDGQGRFKGYQGVGRHITERKRIEEELRSRQEMLELAQKAARAIAFEWRIGDGEGENRWSPDLEAMYGFAAGTYDGTYETWKTLVHPDDWPAVKEAIKHAHRTGDVASEYRVVHPDGSVHWLQAKGRMFFNAEGKPVRMVGFMQDVTQRRHAEDELRKMERQLRQAQRLEAMGTLAGGIAHDFNNILGAILGYGEMALRDAKKGTRQRRDLDSIMTAGERGRALVDRVLAFSRSGVGERVAVHVEEVVREALDLLAGGLPQGIRLRADLRAGCAAMLGDSTQVHQVVMNLAGNGVQAMPQGGVLRVTLEALRLESPRTASIGAVSPGEYLVLKVADTGTGISPEILERMFDPFFTTKEVGVGSGLGLSLVHGIVANVGGAIDVATELGKGSTFSVYLPRCGDAVPASPDEHRPLPRGDGQRVLVVDDEEPLVRLATETLEQLGYVPVGFTSSANALQAFGADPRMFDAVLTDERMPGMSGMTIIGEMRRLSPSIPILLMSGYLGAAAANRARELGANDVLKKPLLARELATSLARVLQH